MIDTDLRHTHNQQERGDEEESKELNVSLYGVAYKQNEQIEEFNHLDQLSDISGEGNDSHDLPEGRERDELN